MDPNSQNTFTSGDFTPRPTGTGAPKKRWSPLRKTLVIIGGVLLALILFVVAVYVFGGGIRKPAPKTSSSNAHDPSLYINRPGYDVTDGIGDPAALVQLPANGVVQYGGQNVIQACSVASLKDISDAGFYLSANSLPGNVTRTFFDGKGAGAIGSGSELFLPNDDDSNGCSYKFQSGKGDNMSVEIYQPSYTNVIGMNFDVNYEYRAAADAHGLQVLTQKPPTDPADAVPTSSDYFIRSGNTGARVHIDSADTNAKSKLLDRIESNFAAALTTATQLTNFDYKSPIFKGAVTMPCTLTDNTTVKTVLGVDAGQLVHESIASAIGVVEQSASSKSYNYVEDECDRGAVGDDYLDVPKVRVITETYEDVAGAKGAMLFDKSQSPFTKGVIATPSVVGDESFFADTAELTHALVFRKGRVLAFVTYDMPMAQDSSVPAATRLHNLMPAMAQIVGNIKNY